MSGWARSDVREAFAELVGEQADDAIGWKIGVASAEARSAAGIDAPLVGILHAPGRILSGASIDVADWTNPRLEPEIAVHLGADVPAGATAEEASAAITGIALAFELVDAGPLADAPAVLRQNIYQRGVVLGEQVSTTTAPAVTVLADGQSRAEIADPRAVSGDYVPLVQHVASVLGAVGRTLSAGQVIITGSLIPPLALEPGRYTMRGDGLGEIEFTVGA